MDIKKMDIIKLAKYSDGLNQSDVIKQCKAKGLRPLSNLEWDTILQNDELRQKYFDYWPAYTSDTLSYNKGETKAKHTQWGKKPKPIYLPLKDGFYQVDKLTGIPNGKPSNSDDKDARYLYRLQNEDWRGLLARGGYDVFYGRRYVFADQNPSFALGVLAVKDVAAKPHKHNWQTTCVDCGGIKGKKKN